ncbi:MAG: family 10 glycosylhydrolase [Acaryochloridaceae cyanobacterium CSU_3_4]|nr:family 10 glycosylhydrolase [Acaryochloridaceae cyanobacterium CSU_3_4]
MTNRFFGFHLSLVSLTLTAAFIAPLRGINLLPVQAQTAGFCQTPPDQAKTKLKLLRDAIAGDDAAQQAYDQRIKEDAGQLQQCRSQNWPQNQAIWLRLYECDLRPGVLDTLLDLIASRGYNQVYVEVFYNGRVLLPAANNPTVWSAEIRNPQYANRDLLAEVIQKGRKRGLKVYAWLFSLNYGYQYSQRPDRRSAMARNGKGKTSLDLVDYTDPNANLEGDVDNAFVDPYSPQARQDYAQLLQAILQRRPDGILFDYIRYPRQTGGASITSKLSDLWIFGNAAQQALINRALNEKGRTVIQRYLQQGYISASDLKNIDASHPTEQAELWQGRQVPPGKLPPPEIRLPRLNRDLWLLSVAHAYQGVVDYLSIFSTTVSRQGIPAGAAFFPDANRRVGQGYDSRMQPWHRFPKTIEWHPMSYGTCGDTSCIVEQVQHVLQSAGGAPVQPVLAGQWGSSYRNRPSLEAQMAAIRQVAPQIRTVSHFDFSWQDPQFANARRACRVTLLPTEDNRQ